MDVATVNSTLGGQPTGGTSANQFGTLSSTDFFQLIISDLLNQDPLKPTDNDQLMRQIASVREIEMNTQMTDSLRYLVDQQRFGSAATLIGQYVESNIALDEAGTLYEGGVVTAVRFDAQGMPILQLDNGGQIPMNNVRLVTSLDQMAQALVGKIVTADIVTDGVTTEIQDVVMNIDASSGQVMLQLSSGQQIGLAQVKNIQEN